MRSFARNALLVAPAVGLLGLVGSAAPALAAGHGHGHPLYFTGGSGTAAWVAGTDTAAPADTDGKVLQLSSPDGSSYAGVNLDALDGLSLGSVTALSYDYRSPDYAGLGGGSPRLVVGLDDGGTLDLNPVTDLSTGWTTMDAIGGAVDNQGGSLDGQPCGTYQLSWTDAVACHPDATITGVWIVNDPGWLVPGGLTVDVDNITLNSTVYSAPGDVGSDR